jgi:HD-GYP domain-containing protein (c-di-GMP phosphodiesterase class II)
MITQALDRILSVNGSGEFADVLNRPKYLGIFQEHKELPVVTGDLYASSPTGFSLYSSGIRLDRHSCTSLALAGKDVFTINAPAGDAGELRSFQENFHPRLRELIGEALVNSVGYHNHGQTPGLVIGFNYPQDVSRWDGEVMKSLAITMNSLSTLAQQITDIKEGFIYMIEALSRASEVNDEDTGNHVVRINTYAKRLCMLMDRSEEFCNEIGLVAQMHDVGKIHTPSNILRKPASLTPSEMEIMRQHTLQGEIILGNSPRLIMARNIAGGHHENYDGSGYPRGLKGDKIPLEAQIVKIVDVYDALRTRRSYKEPMSHGDALKTMLHPTDTLKPSHFNPVLLELFRKEASTFAGIYENLM